MATLKMLLNHIHSATTVENDEGIEQKRLEKRSYIIMASRIISAGTERKFTVYGAG